ncbi:portal protein [Castellaniella sp. FW104-16D08]|uniref:portal protein n=1 Tax=unclassified Castellaniella TaxID=2617606 RepID=UPI00331624BA
MKQRLMARKSAMWQERSTWIKRYRDITDVLLPYAGRYFASDRNKGDRPFNSIFDSTATWALDIMSAGLMSGMTSPARPWFQLATPDRELMDYQPVRLWLDQVAKLMRDIYAKGNTYNALHTMYEELGAFATSATIIEPDFDDVIRHQVLTAGEYALATDDKGRVNTLVREFQMTLLQVVEKFVLQPDGSFDWSRVSATIKHAWDTHKSLDQWITVVHFIGPRTDRDMTKQDSKNMRFGSWYMEPGRANGDEVFLRESGYSRFPALAPRWNIRGGDIYGNGPSFRALGDIQQLQQEQLRKGQAIDFQTKPPIQVPADRKNSQISMLPGGVSYIPMGQNASRAEPLFESRLDLSGLLEDIQDVRGRINRNFYVDLFLMISQDNRRTPATATEIAERHEEKLLMLGPVLERMHNELLAPQIDLTFARMVATGILPPPPRELRDVELKVEFISILAQAQKMIGLGSLDRLLGTVGQLASADPSVLDKIDSDKVVDHYAEMLGVDPTVMRSDKDVAQIRDQRAQAAKAQAQAAAIPPMAGAAKDLSQADLSGNNALTSIMEKLQGYNAPMPQ